MAKVIITFRIMPEGVDVSFDDLKGLIIKKITNFGGIITEEKKEPVAFGLSSLNITFNLDENKGDTEKLEDDMNKYFSSVRSKYFSFLLLKIYFFKHVLHELIKIGKAIIRNKNISGPIYPMIK